MLTDPLAFKLLQDSTLLDYELISTETTPLLGDEGGSQCVVEARTEDLDILEEAAFGLLFAIGVMSFADARPAGFSDMHCEENDEWKVEDMVERLRFVRGELHVDTDYERGRLMKTTMVVRKDGTFTITTVHRGESAVRWIKLLMGKKHIGGVVQGGDDG